MCVSYFRLEDETKERTVREGAAKSDKISGLANVLRKLLNMADARRHENRNYIRGNWPGCHTGDAEK